MKYLNNYTLFVNETKFEDIEMIEFQGTDLEKTFTDADILESIVTDSESLIKSINGVEVDIVTTFKLDPNQYSRPIKIEDLYNDQSFNKQLSKNKYFKNELELTKESETFLDETIDIKFFSVFKDGQSVLDNPEFIVFQSKKKNKNWEPIKMYKVNDNIRNFYDKLTSKKVEIKKGDKTYEYSTSNSGVDWQLSNINLKDDTFKEYMSNDDIKAILTDKGISITIIA